jgi:hypothetical protein
MAEGHGSSTAPTQGRVAGKAAAAMRLRRGCLVGVGGRWGTGCGAEQWWSQRDSGVEVSGSYGTALTRDIGGDRWGTFILLARRKRWQKWKSKVRITWNTFSVVSRLQLFFTNWSASIQRWNVLISCRLELLRPIHCWIKNDSPCQMGPKCEDEIINEIIFLSG